MPARTHPLAYTLRVAHRRRDRVPAGTPGGGNLFFQLVNARYEQGAMILTSNRGFAERGDLFGDPVVATALLDRALHHALVIQIEGSSYRLRQHADLVPKHLRRTAPITTPAPMPRRRGRPPKNRSLDHQADPPPNDFSSGASREIKRR